MFLFKKLEKVRSLEVDVGKLTGKNFTFSCLTLHLRVKSNAHKLL